MPSCHVVTFVSPSVVDHLPRLVHSVHSSCDRSLYHSACNMHLYSTRIACIFRSLVSMFGNTLCVQHGMIIIRVLYIIVENVGFAAPQRRPHERACRTRCSLVSFFLLRSLHFYLYSKKNPSLVYIEYGNII